MNEPVSRFCGTKNSTVPCVINSGRDNVPGLLKAERGLRKLQLNLCKLVTMHIATKYRIRYTLKSHKRFCGRNLKKQLTGISITLNWLKISVIREKSGIQYVEINRLAQLLSKVCFSCGDSLAGRGKATDVKPRGHPLESRPLPPSRSKRH